MVGELARRVDLDDLVDKMFTEPLSDEARAELLDWVRAWDMAHPDVDAAHRLIGWIDAAYAYQSRDRLALR